MKFAKRMILLSLLCMSTAQANYWCTGKVTGISVSKTGSVFVSTDQGFSSVAVCTIGTTGNGVSPELCRNIYATLLTAYLTDKSVTFAFDDALTCSNHPAWGWLTGWYHGPEL